MLSAPGQGEFTPIGGAGVQSVEGNAVAFASADEPVTGNDVLSVPVSVAAQYKIEDDGVTRVADATPAQGTKVESTATNALPSDQVGAQIRISYIDGSSGALAATIHLLRVNEDVALDFTMLKCADVGTNTIEDSVASTPTTTTTEMGTNTVDEGDAPTPAASDPSPASGQAALHASLATTPSLSVLSFSK